jgi:flavin-dependent dehydrogenase
MSRFDVAIVGGGPAGLAAALILGRMRRSVLLLDADDPAHAPSEELSKRIVSRGSPHTHLGCIVHLRPKSVSKPDGRELGGTQ